MAEQDLSRAREGLDEALRFLRYARQALASAERAFAGAGRAALCADLGGELEAIQTQVRALGETCGGCVCVDVKEAD